jgi:hypothetical protein
MMTAHERLHKADTIQNEVVTRLRKDGKTVVIRPPLDITIWYRGIGVDVELKTEKQGKLTAREMKYILDPNTRTIVGYGVEDAMDKINEYFEGVDIYADALEKNL